MSKIERFFPERREEVEHLKNIVLKRLSSVEEDIALFDASYVKRIAMVPKTLFKGTNMKEFRQRIGMFLIPQMYLQYLRLKGNSFNKQYNSKQYK